MCEGAASPVGPSPVDVGQQSRRVAHLPVDGVDSCEERERQGCHGAKDAQVRERGPLARSGHVLFIIYKTKITPPPGNSVKHGKPPF